MSKQASSSYQLSPPSFPSRLKKKCDNQQFCKFLDVLKQLHINIMFVDPLVQMPSYVIFLKEILAKKDE